MAYKQLIKQASMQGIAASSIATASIPTTGTHHYLYMRPKTSGGDGLTRTQILADIGKIVLRINGETIVDATADFLLDRQKFYGDAIGAGNVDGVIVIPFAREHLATDQERSVYALGTKGVSSIQIEATIDAVAQLSTMEIFSEISTEQRGVGQHVRINKFAKSHASASEQEITDLPRVGASVGYLAMHIEENAGTLKDVTVKIGNQAIFDQVEAQLNTVLLNRQKRTPQSGYYHVDFARSNDLGGFLPMADVQDFRQLLNWSVAPTTYNIFTERVHGLRVLNG